MPSIDLKFDRHIKFNTLSKKPLGSLRCQVINKNVALISIWTKLWLSQQKIHYTALRHENTNLYYKLAILAEGFEPFNPKWLFQNLTLSFHVDIIQCIGHTHLWKSCFPHRSVDKANHLSVARSSKHAFTFPRVMWSLEAGVAQMFFIEITRSQSVGSLCLRRKCAPLYTQSGEAASVHSWHTWTESEIKPLKFASAAWSISITV